MNVIISNEQQSLLSNLDIEIIKSINGVYQAEEIVEMFSNFFFGKMIFDVTALAGYKDPRNFQTISISLDVEKIILLLPNIPECNDSKYISKLISMGFYNFTTNIDGLNYLLANPNSYRDVAHLHVLEDTSSGVSGPSIVETKIINNYVTNSSMILGFKNLTIGAGSTSLIYMLKKELTRMGISNVAIEIGRRDFNYLNDPEMISVEPENVANEIVKHRSEQVVLLDLNEYDDLSLCTDVFYLLEPSFIKLNKLMVRDRNIFEKYKDAKIMLVKSMLSDKDVDELEYEARTKFFFNMPPLDDRKSESEILDKFLSKLGLVNYQ